MKRDSLNSSFSKGIIMFVVFSCTIALVFSIGFGTLLCYILLADGYLFPFKQESQGVLVSLIYRDAYDYYCFIAGIGILISSPHLMNYKYRLYLFSTFYKFSRSCHVRPKKLETNDWFETGISKSKDTNITLSRLNLKSAQ